MNENFDRAPGAGRVRVQPTCPGLSGAGDGDAKTSLFNQREPLRQPRTSPPLSENNISTSNDIAGADARRQNKPQQSAYDNSTAAALVKSSKLSANAAVFVPFGGNTDESTAIPNFSYTGARLCNHLSHNLAISPASGNFRQRLLQRCQKEYEQRAVAVQGDKETQKSFHSFVLFLGEVYLNLEVKSGKGTPNRANILLAALKELLNSLFSNPVDANLICAVKLLKLTGSVLEDAWKESGKSDMEELIHRIEAVVLDASCSRDVKQMLLKLVELRSSDWGRVHGAAAASNATPDNDPNYFMNEPTFYTADGTPFTAADPEYSEKYQEILDREEYFPELYEENGDDSFYFEDEMDPEIEEAFENFCLESERKRQQ
ncbi:polyadenylate-binding protein-interacting protein 1 isoform 2-T2 [Polymixia lowei]